VVLLAAGCGSHINLEVMQPALVTVPSSIQTIAVVDRSKAKNIGEGILGVLEGAVTGEDIGADTEGRVGAVAGLVDTLAASPRFDVVRPSIKNKELESSLFDSDLSWETARKICKQSGCDGIVSLDAFDSDVMTEFSVETYTEEDDKGREVTKTRHLAAREVTILTAWRLYDVQNEHIIDDLRDFAVARSFQEYGDTRAKAESALPAHFDTTRDVSYYAGSDYARRIAPTPMWVSRAYYGGGSPDLKAAKNWVKATDWVKAAQIWERLSADDPGKVGAKATFNMALYREVEGDLDGAVDWAKQAAGRLGNGKARRYVRTLQQRRRDAAVLDEQLAAPEPPVEELPPAKPANIDHRRDAPEDDSGSRGMSRPD
jgi:hypothetical protein